MKGQQNVFVMGMIAVLVGAILIFSVIIPIVQNGTLGDLVTGESVGNSSVLNTTTNYTVANTPVRDDTTFVTALLPNGTDVTSFLTVVDATNGVYTLDLSPETGTSPLTMDYRFFGSAFITDGTTRTITGIVSILAIVVLIVALASMITLRMF